MTQKHDIKHGDLIHVDGYDNRPFFVDRWTEETIHEPESTWTEVWFDITCAFTGEYMMAELNDVTRICGADQADDYLMYHTAPMPKFDVGKLTINLDIDEMIRKGLDYKKEDAGMNRKPTQRELSSQEAERKKQARRERREQIDNLLDIRNWNAERYEETSERVYRMKVEEIDAELAKMAAEGRR